MGIINLDNTIGSDDMKIEKLSENQIRCTLNKSDLTSRQLKISELAYGSEKAKELFRDMMQQASYELGFEADDIPIMIEAIPVSADCIVLIVTKVDDPEELDTRFSKFTPSTSDYDDPDNDSLLDEYNSLQSVSNSADIPTAEDELPDETGSKNKNQNIARPDFKQPEDILNLFSKVREYLNKNIADNNKTGNEDVTAHVPSDFDPEELLKHNSKEDAKGTGMESHNSDSNKSDITDSVMEQSQTYQTSDQSSLDGKTTDTKSAVQPSDHGTGHVSDYVSDHANDHLTDSASHKTFGQNASDKKETDSKTSGHKLSDQSDTLYADSDDKFIPLKDSLHSKAKSLELHNNQKKTESKSTEKVVRVFTFDTFNHFNEAAIAVYPVYNDRNSLYKDPRTSKYYLTIEKSICSAVNFNKTCNILSEYGKKEHLNTSSVNFFSEHLDVIIKNKAIQVISRI